MGHALMENRNGLIVGAVTTTASGHAEREAAPALIEPHAMSPQLVTLGGQEPVPVRRRGAMTAPIFVTQLQDKAFTPNVAQNTSGRRSAIDDRITRHPGDAISQRIRNPFEEGGRLAQDGASRAAQDRFANPRDGRLQPRPAAQIARGGSPMSRHTSHAPSAANSTCHKTHPPLHTDCCGSQSALKLAFFSTLLVL
jgi:hypothetical protein